MSSWVFLRRVYKSHKTTLFYLVMFHSPPCLCLCFVTLGMDVHHFQFRLQYLSNYRMHCHAIFFPHDAQRMSINEFGNALTLPLATLADGYLRF